MVWVKKGVIFDPKQHIPFPDPIAQLPTPFLLNEETELIRIYFSYRNQFGQSQIGFFDYEMLHKNLINLNLNIGLKFGEIGCFDDSGLMPSSIVKISATSLLLFYTGWTTAKTVPYKLAIGLAESSDNGITFKKHSIGPILSTSPEEPYFTCSPRVFKDKNEWRMFYVSCRCWGKAASKYEPVYILRTIESKNPHVWTHSKPENVLHANEPNTAYTSANLVEIDDQTYMWYCKRSISDFRNNPKNSYTIECMKQNEQYKWESLNKRDFGLSTSNEGWDSQMVAYPYIIKIRDRLCLFYNGNGFGRSGIGLALWE